MTNLIKHALKGAGYRLTRWGHSNRFQAMDEALSGLALRGFSPSLIIDGGANRGEWARLARAIFPATHVHLVEPLPKCVEVLGQLAQSDGNMTIHPFAASAPAVHEVTFNLVGEDGMATSAQVALPGERLPHELVLPARSLDEMIDTARPGALLKLDLQGHEIEALKGGLNLLSDVEVIVCEVSFYPVNDNGRPVFADLAAFVSDRGFVLYDFASLSGRHRDNRLQWGDAIFVSRKSNLLANNAWRTA